MTVLLYFLKLVHSWILVYQFIKFVTKIGEQTVHIMRVIYEECIPVHIRKIIIKVTEHSFKVPMPNSPLFLDHL